MKPRLRHRLINGLFGNFITNFFYFFNDTEFEAGCEFTSEFLSNISPRLYLPDNIIVNYGESFNEMFMIQESCVSLSLRADKEHMYQLKKLGYNMNDSDDEENENIFPEFFTPGDAHRMIEFFILPTYSYFGDYQILYDLRSQIQFKAGDGNQNRLLICLCLQKEKLLEMMDDFPDGRKFYMERSW